MKITKITDIYRGQDGAFWGDWLIRFGTRGDGRAYRIADGTFEEVAQFRLDGCDKIVPHSNAVMFGCEHYAPEDEFPLLYTNIYNNYAKEEDNLAGTCCVYRVLREGNEFTTQLVQMIRIGFVKDPALWCSAGSDVRPYGNFTIDREQGILYAFTMRDEAQTTRYFAFPVPKSGEGVKDETLGVPVVTLTADQILRQFDCPYHHFIQGACCHEGKIYSVEGFTRNEKNPPALRIIDLQKGEQEIYLPFGDFGMEEEAEFIDFYNGKCYYSELEGALYTIDF